MGTAAIAFCQKHRAARWPVGAGRHSSEQGSLCQLIPKRGWVRASLLRGLAAAALWGFCSSFEGGEPGVRPGGRGTFLCFAKAKYPKERRPEVRATSWFPALLAPGGVSLNSLRSDRREPLSTWHSAARPCPTGQAGTGSGGLAGGRDCRFALVVLFFV